MINSANNSPDPILVCVYSLPRSGSTALTVQLDKWQGVVCLPESYFPQMLELLTPEEFSSPEKMAALFIASSDSGSALTFDESLACMVPNNSTETLKRLGLACIKKTCRNPGKVRAVVWKTTRIIGRWETFARAGGRFLILRRNPLNVFDSQFRVEFGTYNRNPIRFAAFRESYEAVFQRIPEKRTFPVDYESIPEQMPDILTFLGIEDRVPWKEGKSILGLISAKKDWHRRILDTFQSRDKEQRGNLTISQRLALKVGLTLFHPLRPLLGLLRDRYDQRIMDYLRTRARKDRG